MSIRKIAPVHPGEILMEEFLKPLGISQYKLPKQSIGSDLIIDLSEGF